MAIVLMEEEMLRVKPYKLNNPYEASIDSEGNVYVISPISNSVVKYNSKGVYELSLEDSFYYPMGVTVANFGLYVSDCGKHRLMKYDINDLSKPGIPINYVYERDGSPASPWNTAIDSKGNIYMATMGDLIKFNANGENPVSLGIPAFSVAIDKEDIIYTACDGIISKVSRIGRDAKISEIVNLESIGISSVACDSIGKIYAVDMTANCIKVINLSDNTIDSITGYGISAFEGVYSISIDKEDNIYVTESVKNQVIKFDKNWNYLRTFK